MAHTILQTKRTLLINYNISSLCSTFSYIKSSTIPESINRQIIKPILAFGHLTLAKTESKFLVHDFYFS